MLQQGKCNRRKVKSFSAVSLQKLFVWILILAGTNSFAQVTFQARANFNQRLEPTGKVLHGLGQSFESPDYVTWANQYMNALGSSAYPFYYMEYCSIGGLQALIDRTNANIGQITKPNQYYAMQIGLFLGDGPVVPSDADVNTFATKLRDWGRPVFLRIGYEFNGPWNKYTNHENYKITFRKIYNALRAAGANNVATVWCADAGRLAVEDPMKWWPGGAYVDWFALDIFSVASITNKQTTDFIKIARSWSKPVMIGESTAQGVGVNDGQTDWNNWYRRFFDLIRANPEIKAFSYINWNWTIFSQWSTWGDCRINLNTTVTNNYRTEMTSSSIYQHAQTQSAVQTTLRIGQTPGPTTQGYENLARNRPVSASGSCNTTTEVPGNAVDGSIYSKWCHNSTGVKTLRVDLGITCTIVRWVVRHAGINGEPVGRNTRDFKLQYSSDGNTFTDKDPVTGNTANVTDRNISPTSARYFRLYITNSGEDNAARIYEFELIGKSGTSAKFSVEAEEEGGLENAFLTPNPATEETTLTIKVKQAQLLAVDLVNLQGVKVGQVKKQIGAGTQQVCIPVKHTAEGLYLLQFNLDGKPYTRKLLVE